MQSRAREAGVGGAKQQPKKNVAAEARNRRAFGDIGNLATARGIEGKPNRPITRSFCAQLLANADAAAATENNKVPFPFIVSFFVFFFFGN
nr:g2/mitotic-specific cyclin-1 [Quercus suber]